MPRCDDQLTGFSRVIQFNVRFDGQIARSLLIIVFKQKSVSFRSVYSAKCHVEKHKFIFENTITTEATRVHGGVINFCISLEFEK